MQPSVFTQLVKRCLKPILISIAVVVIALIGYQKVFNTDNMGSLSATAFLKHYQQIADVHYSRYLDYEALCEENPPSRSGYFCHSNSTQYRVYGVENNQLYCADATGYQGPIPTLPDGGFYCQGS